MDKGHFSAVIATLQTVDRDGDWIEPGAFGNRQNLAPEGALQREQGRKTGVQGYRRL